MLKPLAALLAALFFTGCAELKPEKFLQDKPLYEHALGLYEKRDYDQAIPFFESLKNRFPQSPYAVESELKIADAQFDTNEYGEAEISYENFRSLHPTHDRIPYVVFRIGMCHFNKIPSGSGRDSLQTQRALASFNELVSRWPDRPEAREARPLIEKCNRSLIAQELYVADFYLKRKDFAAALVRLTPLTQDAVYPDLKAEAKYKMGYAFYRLKKKDEAVKTLEELAGDPRAGKYAREAKSLLKSAKSL
jgi:outer membrane protein assembly factor BamD